MKKAFVAVSRKGHYMKILQVCPRYYPYIGGVEEHVRNISERLAKKHEVVVCSTDSSGKLPSIEYINGVENRRFHSFAPGESYHFSLSLRSYLENQSDYFDIIHAHSYHGFPAFFASLSRHRSNFVFTPHYHGTGHTLVRSILHIPYRTVGKEIFSKADKIVCVSASEKALVEKDFSSVSNKICVIPNGVSLDEFKNFARNKKNHRTILTVGRLENYKGIHHLIKVLPIMDSDIILEIVGKGPFETFLFNLVNELNLNNRVFFYNGLPRKDLLQKYFDADVFALLSEHEAYGICIAESLCAGTPCVVSPTSALNEWIDNKNCFGITLPVNLNNLKNMIDLAMRSRVENASKVLDWSDVVGKLVSLYEELSG